MHIIFNKKTNRGCYPRDFPDTSAYYDTLTLGYRRENQSSLTSKSLNHHRVNGSPAGRRAMLREVLSLSLLYIETLCGYHFW